MITYMFHPHCINNTTADISISSTMLLFLLLITSIQFVQTKTCRHFDECVVDWFSENPMEIEFENGYTTSLGKRAHHLGMAISPTVDFPEDSKLDLTDISKEVLRAELNKVAKTNGCPDCEFNVRRLAASLTIIHAVRTVIHGVILAYVPAIVMEVASIVKNRKKRDAESDAADALSDAIKRHLKNNPLTVTLNNNQKIKIIGFPPDPPDDVFPKWATVVIIVGAILLLALIIVVVVLYMKRKKKQKQRKGKYGKPKKIKTKNSTSASEGSQQTNSRVGKPKTAKSVKTKATNYVAVGSGGKSTTMSTPDQKTTEKNAASTTVTVTAKPGDSTTDLNLSAPSTVQPLDTTTIGGTLEEQPMQIVTVTNTKQSSGSPTITENAKTGSDKSNQQGIITKPPSATNQRSSAITTGKLTEVSKISSSGDMTLT